MIQVVKILWLLDDKWSDCMIDDFRKLFIDINDSFDKCL